MLLLLVIIISLSELLGNYNSFCRRRFFSVIISLSELLGNYNLFVALAFVNFIISLSELLGNYNECSQQKNEVASAFFNKSLTLSPISINKLLLTSIY